ncbi:MAG TPA: hypothetical protein VJZ72_01120 [Candidatus Limnocylindrales bacterium]|nr:hypothetical protein [Candidatus Limnocylindrales bacterium]
MSLLPGEGQALLRGSQKTYSFCFGREMRCHEVTTPEARAVREILTGARFDPFRVSINWMDYRLDDLASTGDPIISIIPLLPHGEWVWGGG